MTGGGSSFAIQFIFFLQSNSNSAPFFSPVRSCIHLIDCQAFFFTLNHNKIFIRHLVVKNGEKYPSF